jgi:hypothetical protein
MAGPENRQRAGKIVVLNLPGYDAASGFAELVCR